MNIFSGYQNKIFKSLRKLEKKKIIKIPSNFTSFTIELPPKNQQAAIETEFRCWPRLTILDILFVFAIARYVKGK